MAAPDNGLSNPTRYITTHDSCGNSVFSDALDPSAIWTSVPGAHFFLGYCTKTFPVDLNSPSAADASIPSDVATYSSYLSSPPGLTVSGGTVLRIVDMNPGTLSPMHRTVSLDYGVVLEGEVELILDGGETRVLRRGDMAVQRATNHAWRNLSNTESARMLFVLVASEEPLVNGEKVGEHLGNMGVRKSD